MIIINITRTACSIAHPRIHSTNVYKCIQDFIPFQMHATKFSCMLKFTVTYIYSSTTFVVTLLITIPTTASNYQHHTKYIYILYWQNECNRCRTTSPTAAAAATRQQQQKVENNNRRRGKINNPLEIKFWRRKRQLVN